MTAFEEGIDHLSIGELIRIQEERDEVTRDAIQGLEYWLTNFKDTDCWDKDGLTVHALYECGSGFRDVSWALDWLISRGVMLVKDANGLDCYGPLRVPRSLVEVEARNDVTEMEIEVKEEMEMKIEDESAVGGFDARPSEDDPFKGPELVYLLWDNVENLEGGPN